MAITAFDISSVRTYRLGRYKANLCLGLLLTVGYSTRRIWPNTRFNVFAVHNSNTTGALGVLFDRRGRPHLQFPAPSWLAALEDASFLGIRRSCLHLYARHSRQPESIPAADSATRWRKAPRRGMPADRGGRTVLGMAIARSPGSWESCALSAKAPLRHRPTGCKQPFNLVTSRLS